MIDVNALLSVGSRSAIDVGVGLTKEQLAPTKDKLMSMGCRVRLKSFEEPRELVVSLKDREIGAAVRGSLSSISILQELKFVFGLGEVMRTAVLEDSSGKQFLLTPVGIDEGIDMQSRTALALSSISYFSSTNWRLKCGVLSKGRTEDSGRGLEIRASIEDGERIVASLRSKGLEAEHYSILIEDAVKGSDLILAPDGVSGNLIFRTLHFVGGCKAFGAPVVNMSSVFVDTSRSKSDFLDSVLLASGLAELKGTRGAPP